MTDRGRRNVSPRFELSPQLQASKAAAAITAADSDHGGEQDHARSARTAASTGGFSFGRESAQAAGKREALDKLEEEPEGEEGPEREEALEGMLLGELKTMARDMGIKEVDIAGNKRHKKSWVSAIQERQEAT
jgi:hypothetical protein